jgi:hypothetical protein
MGDLSYKKVEGGYYPPNSPEYKSFLQMIEPAIKSGVKPFGAHGVYVPKEKTVSPDNYIAARRANPTNKYGAKDRMETQDYGYDKETMGNLLNAYNDAVKYHGVPKMHPDDLANMALVEGRSNFGYNEYNNNNKKANKIVEDLVKRGHDPYAAGFPAALMDKHQTAQRLGVPMYQVWNGSGKAAKDYAQKIEQHRYAVEHPKNKPLRQFIRDKVGFVEDQDMPEQVAEIPMEPEAFKRGGFIDKPMTGSSKLI